MASAALSPVVMIGGWLAAEALQPPSYSPVRSTISGLAGLGGTDRWIMTSALFVVGAGYFVTAAGLPGVRVPARIVLMVAGLSSIGIAVSPEPVRGSTPQHLAWTSLGAVAITIWPAFTARRAPSQPLILRARGAGAVTAVFLALLAWVVFETQGGTALGLAERLVSAVQVTWPFIVALAMRRAAGPGGTIGPRQGRSWSMANALRLELAPKNIRVSALYVAYMDTGMLKGFDVPKLDPADIASLALDGIADDLSRQVQADLAGGVAALYPDLPQKPT